VGVREGVLVGINVAVGRGSRVRVGGRGVQVTKTLVEVLRGIVTEAVSVSVGLGVSVGVERNSSTSTTVSATTVLMGFENAESTISCGSRSDAPEVVGLVSAAAETIQIKLNPNAPAARTVKGPLYSLIFTLFSILPKWVQPSPAPAILSR
jgi:hypothetical protein